MLPAKVILIIILVSLTCTFLASCNGVISNDSTMIRWRMDSVRRCIDYHFEEQQKIFEAAISNKYNHEKFKDLRHQHDSICDLWQRDKYLWDSLKVELKKP